MSCSATRVFELRDVDMSAPWYRTWSSCCSQARRLGSPATVWSGYSASHRAIHGRHAISSVCSIAQRVGRSRVGTAPRPWPSSVHTTRHASISTLSSTDDAPAWIARQTSSTATDSTVGSRADARTRQAVARDMRRTRPGMAVRPPRGRRCGGHAVEKLCLFRAARRWGCWTCFARRWPTHRL